MAEPQSSSTANSARQQDILYFPPRTFSSRFGDNYFTFELTSYTLVPALVKMCGCVQKAGQAVAYVVTVKRGKRQWVIERRFSDFVAFHSHVLAFLEAQQEAFSLPVLPAKTLCPVIDDPFFIEARMKGLAAYLDKVLLHLSARRIVGKSPIKDFLELLDEPDAE
jgi:hypothetical protein